MTGRFTTDTNQMRAMASRFASHAQSIEDEARKIQASSQNNAGATQSTCYVAAGQMNQAFRNIVNMLRGVRDELAREANNRQQREHASRRGHSD